MPAPTLVTHANAVTPAWLTQVLRHNDINGTVTDFNPRSIGTGQVGENVRFNLQGEGDLPASVVGKFVSANPLSKQAGIQQQTYVKEVFFYKTLQSRVDIQTPRVFFTDINENHDFVILMEDLAPAIQGDQIAGCSADDCALALEQLGKLHGPCWGDAGLSQYPVLGRGATAAKNTQVGMIYSMVQSAFMERYASRLSAEHIRVIEKMIELMPTYQQIYAGPKTLLHLDYRLDNMMFGGPRPLTVVDWQSIALGCGVVDASYCVGGSIISAQRQGNEQALLRVYLDVLRAYRVNLSWDECFRLYRAYAPAGMIMAVIASMIVEETARGNDMFIAMARRSCQMIIELESYDLLQP